MIIHRMQSRVPNFIGWLIALAVPTLAVAQEPVVLDSGLHHLRAAGPREWTEFPEQPESSHRELRFRSQANPREWTLELRQQDVKQDWNVLLAGKPLGKLVRDENDMRIYFPLPVERLS